MSTTESTIKDYWNDDFFPLATVGKAILRELREDEAGGDLHRRILGSGSGSHLYFSSENAFQHEKSVPLPPVAASQAKSVSKSLLMGLLPEATLAWMSVDHKLYLWTLGEEEDLKDFEIPSKQSIVSVGIAKPKRGVFKEMVEWCLVVSTIDEVILCALLFIEGHLHIVPTRYTLPTDDIPIVSICGIPDGRIFMGGYDGSLYEFHYEGLVSSGPKPPKTKEQQMKDYYDGTATSIQLKTSLPGSHVLMKGKRAFDMLRAGTERPRKCRKLNHSAKGFSAIASVIVPDWLRKAPAALFGANNTGPLEKIVHDSERQFLYTLSAQGFISLYDMRSKDLTVKASIDCNGVSRQYLSAVAKGHMFAPTTSIEFVGGGVAAQAGVGGMDGARSILKLAETDPKTNVLTPISIHILPRSDSSQLSFLAVTAGGLRYYLTCLSPSIDKSNLAPMNKILMCHVRAPPPVDPATGIINRSFDDREVPGGLVPCLLPDTSVDSTSYTDGHLFMALRIPNQSASSSDKEVGNTIVGTNADFAYRKVANKDNKIARELPGGVTETVSLPAALLPGGRILNSAAIGYSRTSPLMTLTLHSQTPSDSELSVGLVPPYFPKVAQKLDDRKKVDQGHLTTSLDVARSTALVKTVAPLPSRSGITLQLVFNFLLSRPLGYGIKFRSSLPSSITPIPEQQYRISNQYGSHGFSSTARENVKEDATQGASSNHKSPRLSTWLLCPALVPLNEVSMNHLFSSTQTIAVSVGGVHYFRRNTILTCLAEILMKAGPNVTRDAHLVDFCNNYGPKQFCSFSIMLAIGCVPVKGGGNSLDELKSRASKAAFGSGGEPRLLKNPVNGDVRNSFVAQDASSDSLIPSGYEFRPSYLSEAWVLLTSRLLRPIWFKPAVVVTEGQTLKLANTSPRTLPAKVELLLDDESLDLIRSPLFSLMQLMQKVFRRAVEGVPGLDATDSNRMEVDQSSVITGSMRFRGALRLQGNVSDALTIEDATVTARLIEERNLHSLYRLISRSVQLLDLLNLLKRAQLMPDLPEVEWGLLHGLSVSQLVENREGHERIETLLNSLVSKTKVIDEINVTPSADSDLLARSLTSQCFLYFSPGAGLSYLGFRAANEALSCAQTSSKRASLSKQAVTNFKRAAAFWTNAQLITGRFIHSGETESYEQKVKLALQYNSPLASAASLLMKIGEYVAIVDICISTAANFRDDSDALAFSSTQSAGFAWEKSLYHYSKSDKKSSNRTNPAHTVSTVVFGSSVTSKDAISTCHAMILYHLLLVLNSQIHDDYKNGMISACAASQDKEFLKALFEFLVETKNENVLVRIDSVEVEHWLDGTKDPDLKWRYYAAQKKFGEAGELMWNLATDVNQNFSLDERILFLERSQSSFNSAILALHGRVKDDVFQQLNVNRIRAGEHFDIARLQRRTLDAVMSRGLDISLEDEKILMLKSSLLDVSSLYNDYAAEFGLHDVCLHILRSCRHDDSDAIEQLWLKLVIKEIFPCSTRSKILFNFLFSLKSSGTEVVDFLSPDAEDSGNPLFENGHWVDRVKLVLIALGTELYGKDYEFIVPVEFLVSTLEGLRHALHSSPSPPWPLQVLLSIGISFPTLLDAYDIIVDKEVRALMGPPDPLQQFWGLKSIVELLEEWANVAVNGMTGNRAYRELSDAVVSRRLLSRIDDFNAGLVALSHGEGGAEVQGVLDRLGRVEAAIRKY